MNFDVDTLAEAIAHQESGGKYDAISPVNRNGQRAYGKYQLLASNIPAWSREVLGYPVSVKDFLNNPDIQDKVAKTKISELAQKHGNPEDVAAVWFSGRPAAGNYASDVTGTNVPQYMRSVATHYNKLYQQKQQSNDLETRLSQAEAEAKQQNDVMERLEAAEKEAQTLQEPVNTEKQENSNTATQQEPEKVLGIFSKPTQEQQTQQNQNLEEFNKPLSNDELMAGVNNFNNSTEQGIGGLIQRGASGLDKLLGTNLRTKADTYLANRQASADTDTEKYPTASGVGNIGGIAPPALLSMAATGGGSGIVASPLSGYLAGTGSTMDSEGQSQMRGIIGGAFGLGGAIGAKILGSASGLTNKAAPKILEGGKEFNIPVNSADLAPTSSFKPISENVLENTLGVGVKTFRNEQAAATTKAIDKTVSEITGGAKAAAPGDVVKAMQASSQHLDDVKTSLFSKRDALAVAENVEVKPANYTQEINKQIDKLSKMGQTSEVTSLRSELEALKLGDTSVPFQAANTYKEQLGSMTGADGLRGQVSKQLYKALNLDLDASTGSATFNKANKTAIDFYKNAYLPVKENTKLQKIINGSADEKDLLSYFTSDTFVKDARPLLGSKTKQIINSAILNGAREDATTAASELVSNKAFANSVDKYKYSLPQLVGQKNTDKLGRLNDTLRATSRSFESAANPQTGVSVLKTGGGSLGTLAAGAGIGAATGLPVVPVALAGYGANVLLGRLSNNPEVFQNIAKASVPVTRVGTPLTGILTGRATRNKSKKGSN